MKQVLKNRDWQFFLNFALIGRGVKEWYPYPINCRGLLVGNAQPPNSVTNSQTQRFRKLVDILFDICGYVDI